MHAVDGVSFTLARGETLGLVGESGCGKSTVARLLVRLLEPTAGAIRVDDDDIAHASRRALRTLAPPRADRVPGSRTPRSTPA